MTLPLVSLRGGGGPDLKVAGTVPEDVQGTRRQPGRIKTIGACQHNFRHNATGDKCRSKVGGGHSKSKVVRNSALRQTRAEHVITETVAMTTPIRKHRIGYHKNIPDYYSMPFCSPNFRKQGLVSEKSVLTRTNVKALENQLTAPVVRCPQPDPCTA